MLLHASSMASRYDLSATGCWPAGPPSSDHLPNASTIKAGGTLLLPTWTGMQICLVILNLAYGALASCGHTNRKAH